MSELTCKDCPKFKGCNKLCIFMDKLAGSGRSTKELLPPPEPPDNGFDYKDILLEIQVARSARRRRNIADIRELSNMRLKAITALLYAGFSVSDIPYIVELLDIKERRLYQIIEDAKE